MPPEGSPFRLLYDLGCAFAARLELDELIPLVVAKCREVLGAEGAAVLLLDSERNQLHFPYVAEEDPEVAESLGELRFPADQGIAGAVLASGQPVRIDDVAADGRFYPDIDRHTGLTTGSLLAAPLAAAGRARPPVDDDRGGRGAAPQAVQPVRAEEGRRLPGEAGRCLSSSRPRRESRIPGLRTCCWT